MLIRTFFKISELSTITKSDLVSGFLVAAADAALARFSLLLLLRSLRVRVVNGETISKSLDVSTSMFMAEKAACERLADLPTCASNAVSEDCIRMEANGHTMSILMNAFESLLRYPVRVVQGFGSETADISVRRNHSTD